MLQPRIEVIHGPYFENGKVVTKTVETPVTIKDFNTEEGWAIVEFEDGQLMQVRIERIIDFPFHPS